MSRGRRFFAVAAAIFAGIMVFTAWLCHERMAARELAIKGSWLQRQNMEIERVSRAIVAWKDGVANSVRAVSGSDTFRLLLSDLLALPGDRVALFLRQDSGGDEEIEGLIAQGEHAGALLRDTTVRAGMRDARVVSKDGAELLRGGILPMLPETGRKLAKESMDGKSLIFGPVYECGTGLCMDVADPLFSVSGKSEPEAIAAFFATVPLDAPLAGFLAPRKDIEPVIADRKSGFVIAMKGKAPAFTGTLAIFEDHPLPFRRRINVVNDSQCWSMGYPLKDPAWMLLAETPASVIDSAIDSERAQVWLLGLLASAALALLFASIRFFLSRREQMRRADELEGKNRLISDQRDMLDGLNRSITAGIALIDDDGIIRASNPAFARMCGAPEIPAGTSLRKVIPAESWTALSARIARAGKPDETEIHDGGRLYRVGIFPGHDGGCAIVLRDITEFRQKALAEARRQKALVSALVQAIEGVDPNLSGHTRKLRALAAKMAGEMKLDDSRKAALDLAASLSQIGKIFAPREILAKEGPLDEAEKSALASSMKKGADILSDMDFGLPVPEIAAEFNSGVPAMPEAAILLLANSFIAMTSKRGWRKAMGPDEALDILAADARFGKDAIEALRRASRADWQ